MCVYQNRVSYTSSHFTTFQSLNPLFQTLTSTRNRIHDFKPPLPHHLHRIPKQDGRGAGNWRRGYNPCKRLRWFRYTYTAPTQISYTRKSDNSQTHQSSTYTKPWPANQLYLVNYWGNIVLSMVLSTTWIIFLIHPIDLCGYRIGDSTPTLLAHNFIHNVTSTPANPFRDTNTSDPVCSIVFTITITITGAVAVTITITVKSGQDGECGCEWGREIGGGWTWVTFSAWFTVYEFAVGERWEVGWTVA